MHGRTSVSPKTISSSFTAIFYATATRTSDIEATTKPFAMMFETATPFDTPRRMKELVAWLVEAREVGRLHPLLIVAVFIVVFLEIHPFQDGNGRLSRVLTTLLLLQAGYLPMCRIHLLRA
jgi:Fic family protein